MRNMMQTDARVMAQQEIMKMSDMNEVAELLSQSTIIVNLDLGLFSIKILHTKHPLTGETISSALVSGANGESALVTAPQIMNM